MKKIIFITFALLIGFCGTTQTLQQVDSANVYLRDSLYNIKSTFIGKPFANLADAIGNNFRFSTPNGAGNRTKGTAYYKSPLIFLPRPNGIPNRGFEVVFANNMPVDLGKMRAVGLDQWDILMRAYLRTAIVTDIKKFQ